MYSRHFLPNGKRIESSARPQEKINKLQKSGDGKENSSAGFDPSSNSGGFEGDGGDGGDRVGEKLYTGRNPENVKYLYWVPLRINLL